MPPLPEVGWPAPRGATPVAGLLAACLVMTGAPAAHAQEAPEAQEAADEASRPARLVRVRLPLTGNADRIFGAQIQRATDQLLAAAPAPEVGRPILVIELTRAVGREADADASEYERCLALARQLLRDVTGVRTIAYLPQTVKGHAVLVAMACEEIAMAPDAQIGEAGAAEDAARPVEPAMAETYEQTAAARRTVPAAIARGMIDREAEVMRVEDETGVDFVLRENLEELRAERAVASTEVLIPAGSSGLFTGREAWELGFVKYLAPDAAALARALGLPRDALRVDQSIVADWRPRMIELSGEITPGVVSRTTSLIGSEISAGANWIGLRIDSGGGPLDQCQQLAETIAELNEGEVRTVAYVPVEARGGAALVGLACDQLVMHPDATVGGRVRVAGEAPEEAARALPGPEAQGEGDQPQQENRFSRDTIDSVTASLRGSLAPKTGRTWSLLAATIDPELRVYRFSHRETGETALFSQEEADSLPDSGQWRRGDEITSPGEALALDAERAQELGVAFAVVSGADELNQLYGFAQDPVVAEPNWALELVEALASPQVAFWLLFLGFVGVYIEMQAPGLGVGGFLATVCFLLFFWSHFLSGSAGWLEVILFLAGVAFILLEIFVLPGFGVFGLGGVAMVLASIILALMTFVIPKTESQLEELRGSMTLVAGSLIAFLVAGFFVRKFLPHTPGLRRMMLMPAGEAELAELDHREATADYAYLVGRTGVAATNLMPSGRAEIDGELLDVIAQGEVIDRGEPIVVHSARGNRVLVRKASSP